MKKYLTLFGIILVSTIVFSQELKTYSGVYCENCEESQFIKNEATYSYYENDKLERIFDGTFKYTSINFSDERTINHYKLTIIGQYNNNFQNGLWTYKRAFVDGKSYYSYKLWGETNILHIPVTNASGKFELGYRVGKWELKTLLNKKVTENFLAYFDKTKFQSNFLFETDAFSVKGIFNDEGYLNGDWDITWYLDKIPYRTNLLFVNGIIAKSITQNLSTGDVIKNIDNSSFVNKIFENLKENKFYSLVDNKIYILEDKKHTKELITRDVSYYKDSPPQFYSESDMKNLGISLLYSSLNFWIYPTITKKGYTEGYIFAEIRKGIIVNEYITERKIIEISEDELLELAEEKNFTDKYIDGIIIKRKIAEEKLIAEKKRIKEEERKAKELEENKKLLEINSNKINSNEVRIMNLYGKKKKSLYNAINILTKYYVEEYDVTNSLAIYSDEKLQKSIEFIKMQELFKTLFLKETKEIEKKLKNIDDPQIIINLINSYNYGN